MEDNNKVNVRQPGNNEQNNPEGRQVNRNYGGAVDVNESVSFSRLPPPPYSPYEIPSVSGSVHLPTPTTIIVQQQLKHRPMHYTCHNCLKRIVTRVEYVNSRKTHMLAGFICGFTLWCFLCCLAAVPYMASSFKKAVHYCPNCKACLGSH